MLRCREACTYQLECWKYTNYTYMESQTRVSGAIIHTYQGNQNGPGPPFVFTVCTDKSHFVVALSNCRSLFTRANFGGNVEISIRGLASPPCAPSDLESYPTILGFLRPRVATLQRSIIRPERDPTKIIRTKTFEHVESYP